MFIPNLRRLSRRRFVSLAAAAASAAFIGDFGLADAADVTLVAPYFPQGGTGSQSTVNCGPATVAAAVNYSGVASPTVQNVRKKLGFNGATSLEQWGWLLDEYEAPWFPTNSRDEMDRALRTGHVIVIAAWMENFSHAPDFEEPFSPFSKQSGRYDEFAYGHALLITGIADSDANYLIHDPNVFPKQGKSFYGDGAPKGSYRRYSMEEVWKTIDQYADGLALAVASNGSEAASEAAVKRGQSRSGGLFAGPGGGHAPDRGSLGVTGEVVPASERGVISAASDDGDEDDE